MNNLETKSQDLHASLDTVENEEGVNKSKIAELRARIESELENNGEKNQEFQHAVWEIECDIESLLENLDNQSKESENGEHDVLLESKLHDIEFANSLEKAKKGEVINENDKNGIMSLVSRRDWGNLIGNLEAGDNVISLLSPVSKELSIKNMNDNVFGPQTVDQVIIKARKLFKKIFTKKIVEAGKTEADSKKMFLESNYKTNVLRIPDSSGFNAKDIMNEVCEELDVKMKYFLKKFVDEQMKVSNLQKQDKLKKFIDEVMVSGYRTTFGISNIDKNEEKSNSIDEKISAINGSMQVARISSTKKNTEYGGEYNENLILERIKSLNGLASELENSTVRINDSGKELNIRVFNQTDNGSVLNRNLLRDIRKNKISFADGEEEKAEKIKKYIADLNIFDLVKPFTDNEKKIKMEEISRRQEIIAKIGLGDKEALKSGAEIASEDVKDARFTSEVVFHSKAIEINNCAYLSLDVLDVGVDQLLSYEKLVQTVNDEKTLRDALLTTGDKMTDKLKKMRNDVYDILVNKYKLILPGDKVNGLVGGDELLLAIDLDEIKRKKINLDELIRDIKKVTNSRITKTVVARSDRHTETGDTKERLKEHLQSIKDTEKGNDLAKKIESEINKLQYYEQSQPELKQIIDNLTAKLAESFVFQDKNGNFLIDTGDNSEGGLGVIEEKDIEHKIFELVKSQIK